MLMTRYIRTGLGTVAGRLARHLIGAGALEEALSPLLEAAERRLAISDYGGATRLLTEHRQVCEQLEVSADDPRFLDADVLRVERCLVVGNTEDAKRLAETLLSRASGDEHRTPRARCLRLLGLVASRQGRPQECISLLERAADAARLTGDEHLLASCLTSLGDQARLRGEMELSESCYQQAMERFSRSGQIRGRANALMGLGAVARHNGQLDDCLDYAMQATEIFQRLGNGHGEGGGLLMVGDVRRYRRDYSGANMAYRDALQAFERVLSPSVGYACFNIGLTHLIQNEVQAGREVLESRLKSAVLRDNWSLRGLLKVPLLVCDAEDGEMAALEAHWQDVQHMLEKTGRVDADIAWCLERACLAASTRSDRDLFLSLASGTRNHYQKLNNDEAVERMTAVLEATESEV